ncbi:MAG: TIGR03619 family F420-dependent LLM class oxidoreductase [Chloroflexota bacterium]|nr:TIGR03619 family F420-dependent LLM class oxidoreductase [Chloroflexota bacterium]
MNATDARSASSRMTFGVCLPNFRPGASPEGMLAATQTAERLGWHSVWTTDHILIDGAERGADYRHIYEALSVLAWLGGQSSTVRLGTSVLIVPMRSALVLAKELATIDALSGGRLIAGIGIGWNRNEFDNVGVGDRFGHRGAYVEETVALWRYLWGGGQGPYEGRFDSFGEANFSPLPAQGADLPVWIGATAEPALRRVGRIAQGYQSVDTSAADMRERARIIGAAAEAAGRPMPTLSTRLDVIYDQKDRPASALTGSGDDMAGQVQAFGDIGVQHLALDFGETDPDAIAKAMERFDREVIGAL